MPVTLTFEKAGDCIVEMVVEAPALLGADVLNESLQSRFQLTNPVLLSEEFATLPTTPLLQ